MKEQQEFIVDGHSYPIYRYEGNFRRDEETNELILSISLSIPVENIAPISPWVMQQKEKKDVTIVRHLSKNGQPVNNIFMDFLGVRCTGFHEEYDQGREDVVLKFTATFENRIITDQGERRKITELLN
ncbi:MAG: hypothetical protein WA913_12865 [Pricia sp.]